LYFIANKFLLPVHNKDEEEKKKKEDADWDAAQIELEEVDLTGGEKPAETDAETGNCYLCIIRLI
jgi:hypothetical protein